VVPGRELDRARIARRTLGRKQLAHEPGWDRGEKMIVEIS
jgi:hypothetical protein